MENGKLHRSSVVMMTDGPDEEAYYTIRRGQPLPTGRHCSNCGEKVEVAGRPYPVAEWAGEWRHNESGLAHCAIAFQGDTPVGLAEATAAPCTEEGCLGNAEYEAARGKP